MGVKRKWRKSQGFLRVHRSEKAKKVQTKPGKGILRFIEKAKKRRDADRARRKRHKPKKEK